MTISKKFLAAAALFLAVSSCGVLFAASRACVIKIINLNGKAVNVKVEVADTESRRGLGLMYRRVLDDDEGMLFVFETSDYRNFWMKNTYIPLSIAYISKEGLINEIHDMNPLDERVTRSLKPAMYALEMKRGWFARKNIYQGCKIDLRECSAQK
jgi:uncharacterized membrane protein (UPF0127 family)